jgi:hypothetical protein
MLLSIVHPVIRTVIRTEEWRAWPYPKSALTTGLRTNATWGRGAGLSATSFSRGWLRALACAGSTSAAAMAPLPNRSLSDVPRPRFRASIPPRPTHLRALTPGCAHGGISPGRCHGAAVRGRPLRRRRHGAGDFLRARAGQGRRGDGTRRSPGRRDCDLRMGPPGRRISAGTDPGRVTRHGHQPGAAAECPRVAD